MSLSHLRNTEKALDALDRSEESESRPGPVKAWQAGSNRSTNQADSSSEVSGWNPVEVWRQRIKREPGN